MIYFNGYGYNFYTEKYGYYENSPNTPIDKTALYVTGSISICVFLCIAACCAYYYVKREEAKEAVDRAEGKYVGSDIDDASD